ncbi:hypothetical protein MPLB_1700013 [Mesorhizobium sp. ORS 3324]|nr:hypothetical protein MPLB_1700013 [Mesorhizobium sp. ORS 3324]
MGVRQLAGLRDHTAGAGSEDHLLHAGDRREDQVGAGPDAVHPPRHRQVETAVAGYIAPSRRRADAGRPQHRLRRCRDHAPCDAPGHRRGLGLCHRRRGGFAVRRAGRTARARRPFGHEAGRSPGLLPRHAARSSACEGGGRPASLARPAGLGKRPQALSAETDPALRLGAARDRGPKQVSDPQQQKQVNLNSGDNKHENDEMGGRSHGPRAGSFRGAGRGGRR